MKDIVLVGTVKHSYFFDSSYILHDYEKCFKRIRRRLSTWLVESATQKEYTGIPKSINVYPNSP